MFISIGLMLSACRHYNPSVPTNTSLPAEQTVTPSPESSSTATPISTSTVTPSRTPFPSRTPTATRTPTLTPSPIEFAELDPFSPESVDRITALQGHFVNADGLPEGLAFSPNGKLLAVSDQQAYTVWEISTGQIFRRIPDAYGEVAFTPDGRSLAGWYDGQFTIWNLETWLVEKTLNINLPLVQDGLAFSPDGRLLAVPDSENSVNIWDMETGLLIRSFSGQTEPISGIFFSPDGENLVAGSFDDSIRVWDVATGNEIRSMFGDQVALSPDGTLVASRTSGDVVTIWSRETGEEIGKLIVPGNLIIPIAFSHDGQLLASGNLDGSLNLWEVSTGELIRTLSGYTDEVWRIVFSPNGLLLASVNLDGLVVIWGVPEEIQSIAAYAFPPTPTPTPVLDPAPDLRSACLEGTDQLKPVEKLTGRVVLDSRLSADSYLLDLSSCEAVKLNVIDERQQYHSVSPNREYLAYQSRHSNGRGVLLKEVLVVLTADGSVEFEIPIESGWYGPYEWLNDATLGFGISDSNSTFKLDTEAPTFMLLNPFTGDRRVLTADYPDFYYPPVARITWWSIDNFDPTLTRVVYPKYNAVNDEYSYALWNLQSGLPMDTLVSLFAFPHLTDVLPTAHWSPDGSQLIVEGINSDNQFDLYVVSRDGTVEQATQLWSTAIIDEQNLSWSPDGRYVAMYLLPFGQLASGEPTHLAILDTLTLEVTDFDVFLTAGGLLPKPPVWSPDGNFLFIYDSAIEATLLVDLSQGTSITLMKGMEPMGWMKSP